MDEYATITPHQLAALAVPSGRCRSQAADNLRVWFFVILDLHRALYSLGSTHSGSAGIGAY